MPGLPIQRRDTTSLVSLQQKEIRESPSIKPWVTAIIVVSSVLLVTSLVVGVILQLRYKGYRQARLRDPTLSRKQFLEQRRMGAADRRRAEDMQRNMMIRKSMAGRSLGSNSISDTESLGGERGQGPVTGLKEDWKKWEVAMTSERTRLESRHPLAAAMVNQPSSATSSAAIL
ncbi:hypothetical protein DL546_002851 [Coniochaeta pulveracea]|uniref:Uncharacterized protein n=1 Tax=Coniochaeta pulveracea TaxID=177199 RepID=A0A420YLH9_9PEZI|nr:hypothetical protein DL546_002851 [Coniochaeta pulveracea]